MDLLSSLAFLFLLPHCLLGCFADVDFLYNGFEHAANLSLDGSASILRGGALQLTNDSNSIMGHAFFDSPVQAVRDDGVVVSFSTVFVLDIVSIDRVGGHGLAFVVAASKVLPGASAKQFLGLLGKNNLGNSSNHVFAVEFDTVQANGLQGETDGNHVGVDLNSHVSNVSKPAAYFPADDGKNVSVKLESAQPIQADYDGRTKVLNVTIAPVSAMTNRPRRPLISHVVDLLPIFKQDMYVGFSASTGKLASALHPGMELSHWRRACASHRPVPSAESSKAAGSPAFENHRRQDRRRVLRGHTRRGRRGDRFRSLDAAESRPSRDARGLGAGPPAPAAVQRALQGDQGAQEQ